MASLSEHLTNPYHAFVILVGSAFAAAILWPESAPAALGPLMRGPFLPHAVAFLIGFLALEIGEAERGYGAYRPPRRAARLGGLVGFGLVLVLPFLLVHRVEAGLPWPQFAAILGFLYAYGLAWALVGYGAAAVVHWEGLRFVLEYGGLLAVIVLPAGAGLPISPIPTIGGLWAGTGDGWWGLALYAAFDAGALGAWLWTNGRSSGA
ncbi:MAG TPA: hypothetical protein PKG50_01890 [Candidatus Bipolaricaulis anaerobius]|jgi:hypothetical protein|nr:hypothetical protein [Candidatus Bipolaricaulis sp.]MDD2912700.1 hypothetical protein [Candidatus Bipolaricaulis anaerobius]HNR24171.1 hypothetical protein [Candidatus Bipolaricaulis anaerobius]HNS23746.1 hypothetical protein [Candidatus Bipolaricaulis anaerobius]HOD73445.1 hypothetical protein [Candidatus Bipolaricaulis anaerobius]